MRKNKNKLNFTKNVEQVNFLAGDLKSQNDLFHSTDWASAQKLTLGHWYL